jgi:HKD family nuclease
LKLKKTPEIKHVLVLEKGRRLHSKIYLFEKGNDFQVIIGSANLTDNGLRKNEELSTLIEGVKGSNEHTKFKQYFEQLALLCNA